MTRAVLTCKLVITTNASDLVSHLNFLSFNVLRLIGEVVTGKTGHEVKGSVEMQ